MRAFRLPDGHVEIALATLVTWERVHQLLQVAFVRVLHRVFNLCVKCAGFDLPRVRRRFSGCRACSVWTPAESGRDWRADTRHS